MGDIINRLIEGGSLKSEEIVQNAIKELKEDFKNNRDRFFNEHALHHVFYCKLSELGELVHPEYPTRKRFKKDIGDYHEYISGKHSFHPSGENIPRKRGKGPSRGHYDFAILNKEFYDEFKDLSNSKVKEENKFERLSSKDVDTNLDQEGRKYLDIVIEFKYVVRSFKQEDYVDYAYDIFKLTEAEEANKKIFLVFLRKRHISNKRYNEVLDWLNKREKEENGIQIEIVE